MEPSRQTYRCWLDENPLAALGGERSILNLKLARLAPPNRSNLDLIEHFRGKSSEGRFHAASGDRWKLFTLRSS